MFYCGDIFKLDSGLNKFFEEADVKSALHVAITENGVMKGCVGFDECRINRVWTNDEIKMLTFLAKLIAVFAI